MSIANCCQVTSGGSTKAQQLNDALTDHLRHKAPHLFEGETYPWLEQAPEEACELIYHKDFQEALQPLTGADESA